MDIRRLDGKVVMVTGATRGIGLATAERLGAEGAHLVLTARGETDGRDVEARLREAGADAVFVASARSSRPCSPRVGARWSTTLRSPGRAGSAL